MISNIIGGITTQILKKDREANFYYNPTKEIEESGYVLNLLNVSTEKEPNAIYRMRVDWDLYYISIYHQKFKNYKIDERMNESQDSFWELLPYLEQIPVKGFYNWTTKQNTKMIWIPTLDLSIVPLRDLTHLFFSMEFRVSWIREEDSNLELIKDLQIDLKHIKEEHLVPIFRG